MLGEVVGSHSLLVLLPRRDIFSFKSTVEPQADPGGDCMFVFHPCPLHPSTGGSSWGSAQPLGSFSFLGFLWLECPLETQRSCQQSMSVA